MKYQILFKSLKDKIAANKYKLSKNNKVEMNKENRLCNPPIRKKGFISLFLGPMFGGKTSALLYSIHRR